MPIDLTSYFVKGDWWWGNDGSGPYVVDASGNLRLFGYMFSTLSGELQQFNALTAFNGGAVSYLSVTGVVKAFPVGVFRLRCITAGTIKLWDNASAASGQVLVDTIAMTAGQVIELSQLVNNGVYATVTSGTYALITTTNLL